MKELSQAQKNKVLAAAEIVENGDLAVLKKILEFGDALELEKENINTTLDKIKEELSTFGQEINNKVETKLSEIENGKDGKDGENYVLTEEDKQQIAKTVVVPIVEKQIETIVEKTEVVRIEPLVTENVVEVAKYEEPNQIVDKVNKATIKVKKEQVEGLSDIERIAKANAFDPTMGPSFADLKKKVHGRSDNGTTPDITVSLTAPANPKLFDLWYDLS